MPVAAHTHYWDPLSESAECTHGGKISFSEGRQLRPRGFTLRVNFEGDYWFEQRFPSADQVIAFLKSLSPPPQS